MSEAEDDRQELTSGREGVGVRGERAARQSMIERMPWPWPIRSRIKHMYEWMVTRDSRVRERHGRQRRRRRSVQLQHSSGPSG